MIKKKQIPAWYRIYLEKKLERLEEALKWLNRAEKLRIYAHPLAAKACLNTAKEYLNQ